jgi:hypothetical protein
MPWGKHRGRKVADLSGNYLRWLRGLDDIDRELRQAVLDELAQRDERYVPASVVLADIEEAVTARVSDDEQLDRQTAARVSDHLLEAFEEVRGLHGITDGVQLVLPPLKAGPDTQPSEN